MEYEISENEDGFAVFVNGRMWTGLNEDQVFELVSPENKQEAK